jgi:hypothetical protein
MIGSLRRPDLLSLLLSNHSLASSFSGVSFSRSQSRPITATGRCRLNADATSNFVRVGGRHGSTARWRTMATGRVIDDWHRVRVEGPLPRLLSNMRFEALRPLSRRRLVRVVVARGLIVEQPVKRRL